MRHPQTSKPSVRATAIGTALLAHGLLLLLLEIERRAPRAPIREDLQFISLWPRMPTPPRPEAAPQVEHSSAPRGISAPSAPVPVQPSTPPTAPTAPAAPPAEPANQAPRGIDWNAAATAAAARVAEKAGKPATFGKPVKAIPRPCVPRQFDRATEKLMAERLPPEDDPLGVGPDPKGNCLVVGGRPMCVQTHGMKLGQAQVRGDLFEDMDEKRKVSSVPSPDVCD